MLDLVEVKAMHGVCKVMSLLPVSGETKSKWGVMCAEGRDWVEFEYVHVVWDGRPGCLPKANTRCFDVPLSEVLGFAKYYFSVDKSVARVVLRTTWRDEVVYVVVVSENSNFGAHELSDCFGGVGWHDFAVYVGE